MTAVLTCARTIPDLNPPVVTNSTIPESDIDVDAQRMLAAHNLVRGKLSIPDLKWSSQMAAYATEWAIYLAKDIGCSLRHRGPQGLPLHKNGLGENIYKHAAVIWADGRREVEAISSQDVVLAWARQSADYEYVSNSCGLNSACEGYTQLVWRDSQVVGCGAASCDNKDQIWVCNYDPPGNFLNQRPY